MAAEPTEVLNAGFDADPYAALSPGARLVAQAYGVVAPHGLGVNRTAKVLAQASVDLLDRSLTQADVRRANDELINAGICMRPLSPNVGVAATRNWALPLAVRAQNEGRLTKILEAFQATRPSPGVDRYQFETLFRCYVIRGDFGNLDALLEGEESSEDEWRFLAEPLAVDVLATLPARYIDVALAGCLRHTLDMGAPPEPAIHACHRFSLDPARHAAGMAYIRILQGRFDAAEAVFSMLPAEVRDAKPAKTGLASTRAMIAMLRGDNSAARQHIDAAIAAEKAGTRKRNVFPEHASFALSLIALVRLDTPESRDLMQQLLRTAERRYLNRDFEVAFAMDAARVQRDLGIYARRTAIPCYLTFLDGFRNCWLGSDNQASAEWLELMDAYRSRASANGYRWIAAESASILHRLVELRGADLAGLPDPQPCSTSSASKPWRCWRRPCSPGNARSRRWSNWPTTPGTRAKRRARCPPPWRSASSGMSIATTTTSTSRPASSAGTRTARGARGAGLPSNACPRRRRPWTTSAKRISPLPPPS